MLLSRIVNLEVNPPRFRLKTESFLVPLEGSSLFDPAFSPFPRCNLETVMR